ncbi:MAG: hypothetical protein KAV87_07895 [Desulfobacteraceae bacterium]|nr:hypothetical protein [Desulfobacteraceae bacterium]
MFRVIKRFVPEVMKNFMKAAVRDYKLRRSVAFITGLPDEKIADPDELHKLRIAFGNIGFSGDHMYLCEVAKRVGKATGTVLECGSGVSTIIMGILAARHGTKVVSFEQDETYYGAIQHDLRILRIASVQVYHTPLCNYGSYDWYDIRSLDLPDHFEYVFCDGPAFCRGWRSGLVPALKERGIAIGEILCDDADDPHAPEMLLQWEEQYAMKTELISRREGILAVVSPERRN